jgi:hypothetical protein
MDGRGIGQRRCDVGGIFAALLKHGLVHGNCGGLAFDFREVRKAWMDGWIDGMKIIHEVFFP